MIEQRTDFANSSAELIDSVKDKIGEKPCTKEDLTKLQSDHPVHNVFQRRAGLMFRIVGDDIPPDFDKVEHDIGLEDVYLYYMEADREAGK